MRYYYIEYLNTKEARHPYNSVSHSLHLQIKKLNILASPYRTLSFPEVKCLRELKLPPSFCNVVSLVFAQILFIFYGDFMKTHSFRAVDKVQETPIVANCEK